MTAALLLAALAIWLSRGPRCRDGLRREMPGDSRLAVGRSRRAERAAPTAAAATSALACLVVGGWPGGAVAAVVVVPAAAVLVRRLSQRPQPALSDRDRAWIPLTLDLVAAALLAGQPVPVALTSAAPRSRPALAAMLEQASALLRLGARPDDAWSAFQADAQLRPVAVSAVRAATSGIKLADALRTVAGELRADARGRAQARAQRAGVWSIAPLGLCFLPAFVCIGIVPVIIGVATGVLQNTLL